MFRIEHDLASLFRSVAHAVSDHAHILLTLDLKGNVHVVVPGLADHDHAVCLSGQDRGQPWVIVSAATGPTRHSEGGELGPLQFWQFGEEGVVGGVGAGPAAFDIINAELIEFACDHRLVGRVEIHPLGLRAVA